MLESQLLKEDAQQLFYYYYYIQKISQETLYKKLTIILIYALSGIHGTWETIDTCSQ